MKNIFTNIYKRNPITNLFKELYFPLKSKTLSESTPPIPTTMAKFFEIIAYHFDQVYKERVLILSSSFPSNSLILADKVLDLRFNTDLEKFAKERGLYQLKNESNLQFQSRVINAHRFLLSSPMLSGLEHLITSVISDDPKDFTIRELYKESWILGKGSLGVDMILGSNVFSYYFIVDFGQILIPLVLKTYLEDIINLYKPAYVGFHIKAFILDKWILGDKGEKLGINTYIEIN